MTEKTKTLFIFGLGYTGAALAEAARALGFVVDGVRSADFHDVAPTRLSRATHILSTIPPTDAGDVVLNAYGAELHGAWLGYLSTTGVYGDWGGDWVDETSELLGNSPRLKRRVEAENAWRARGANVFRLAGIYGPGRNALEDVLAGTASRIDKPGQFFSRIHVEDIAGAVLAAMQLDISQSELSSDITPQGGAAKAGGPVLTDKEGHLPPSFIFNVCDDLPAPSHEVIAEACRLLEREPPPLIPYAQANISAMAREFYSANRRVSNAKMKQQLGFNLRYPTYREGLAALAQKLQK